MIDPEISEQPIDASARFRLADFTGRGYEKGRAIYLQIMWMIVSRSITMRWWCPNSIRLFILRLFGAKIGCGTKIRHDVKIHWPWKLEIGHDSWIGEGAWILNLEKVTVGSNTCISQEVFLCTGSHDRRSRTFEFDNGPISVGDSVWIAARATVLRGVIISDGVTVGAAALVARNISKSTVILAPESRTGIAP